MTDLYESIRTVSGETGVDARFILAVALQESIACVRAPTTANGVRNPGIMQDHNGEATCNEGGVVLNPCPKEKIYQMIKDGVAGTPYGDGLKQTLAQGGGNWFAAARIYNSGSIDPSGRLEAGGATHCYSSDIANRLIGWRSSQKTCTYDGAPPPPFAVREEMEGVRHRDSASSPASQSQKETMEPQQAMQNVPEVPPMVQDIEAQEVSVQQEKNGRATANKKAPGVTNDCAQYYNVAEGDFCNVVSEKFDTTFDELRKLNTQLDEKCTNLWLGYDYCVKGL
jgi:LysM repeat protein